MRTMKVAGWMKDIFTAGELSGWPSWVDVGGSMSDKETSERRIERRRARAKREQVDVEPLQVSFILK